MSLHDQHFPGESEDYREARNRLLEAERELCRQTERVAALRRALPSGGTVPTDYVFDEDVRGERKVKLSELFGRHHTLVLYNFMYPGHGDQPCPMCSSMLDALDGQVRDLEQRVALAVTAKMPIDRVMAYARERGWRHLRLLSSAHNTYNRDYHGEDEKGQNPMLNVFSKADGIITHRWASELMFVPSDKGQDQRHIDTIWPLWNVLDLTPQGRGEWRPKLKY
jgi:predicted dithiol-disulfide oxidoreductase (DUF899 family)